MVSKKKSEQGQGHRCQVTWSARMAQQVSAAGAWQVSRQIGRNLSRLLEKEASKKQKSWVSGPLHLGPRQQPGLSISGPP